MGKLVALHTKHVSPEIVVQSISDEVASGKVRAIYAVLIYKEENPGIYATGNLNDLCYATIALQDLAIKHVNGSIDEER